MTETPQSPPPGYYPDSSGVQRYWDGNAWTDQTQGSTAAAAPGAAVGAGDKANRPWFKKKRFVIPGALVALLIIGSALGGGGSSDDEKPASSAASIDERDATDTDVKTEKPKAAEKKKAEKPKMTSGQKNALRAAENYLSFVPFSRDGMIRQLSSDAGDGYSKSDATYAADNVKVNYKEQAAKAAKNYLEISPFSRDGMITQLTSSAGDQYTKAQAEYGADKAGL